MTSAYIHARHRMSLTRTKRKLPESMPIPSSHDVEFTPQLILQIFIEVSKDRRGRARRQFHLAPSSWASSYRPMVVHESLRICIYLLMNINSQASYRIKGILQALSYSDKASRSTANDSSHGWGISGHSKDADGKVEGQRHLQFS